MNVNRIGWIVSAITFIVNGLVFLLIDKYKTKFLVNIGLFSVILFTLTHAILILVLLWNNKSLKRLFTVLLLFSSLILSSELIVSTAMDIVDENEKLTVKFINTTGGMIDSIFFYDNNKLLAKVKDIQNDELISQEYELYSNANANLYYYIKGEERRNLNLFDCDAIQRADSFENSKIAYFKIGIDKNICFLSFRGD